MSTESMEGESSVTGERGVSVRGEPSSSHLLKILEKRESGRSPSFTAR